MGLNKQITCEIQVMDHTIHSQKVCSLVVSSVFLPTITTIGFGILQSPLK